MTRSLLALAACLVAGCSDIGFDVRSLTELERAEARWERFGPESYVYEVRRLCYCGVESIGPVRVLVGSNAVVRTYVESGAPVPEDAQPLFPTVQGLFALLRAAFAEAAAEVDVSYDPALGYPTELWIDYDERVADEELGMTVTEPPVAVFLVAAPAR